MPEGGLAQGAPGLVVGWAGQSGVLAPWGCDCGCSLRASVLRENTRQWPQKGSNLPLIMVPSF